MAKVAGSSGGNGKKPKSGKVDSTRVSIGMPTDQHGRPVTARPAGRPKSKPKAAKGKPSSPAPHGHDHEVALDRSSVLFTRLQAMIAAAPGTITVTSGERSTKRQQELWDEALKKYGDPEIADNWVARPGNSQHEHGNAADLKFSSPEVRDWFHANAKRFGLHFPLGNEAWHIEVVEARGGKLAPEAVKAGIKPAVLQGKRATFSGAPTPVTPPTSPVTPGGAKTPATGATAPVTASDVVAGTAPLPGTGSGPGGKKVAGDYGFAASFFNSDPELKRLLADATAQDWSAEKFAVQFQNTSWYRKHSASAREWIMLNHNDPAAARRKVEVTAAQIHKMALESGADITGLEAHDMAVKFLAEGWSEPELTKRVGAHVEFKRGEPFRGEAGANYDALKRRALEFGLTLSDDQLARWVRDLATQTKTLQDFENAVKEQAKILYPALERQIAAGLTPQDIAGLYVQSLSDILEIDPNSVNWAKDPLIKRAMSHKSPDAKEVGAMALWEFEMEAKKDPRWAKTKNAHDSLMGAGGDVLRDWGLAH